MSLAAGSVVVLSVPHAVQATVPLCCGQLKRRRVAKYLTAKSAFSVFSVTVGVSILLTTCTVARGELVRFKMTGMIGVSDPFNLLPTEITEGASADIFSPPPPGSRGKEFVAVLSYDTSVSDEFPDNPSIGLYTHPVVNSATAHFGLWVQIGNYSFRSDPSDPSNPFRIGVTAGGLYHGNCGDAPFGCTEGISVPTVGVVKSFQYRFTGHTIEDSIELILSRSIVDDHSDLLLTSDELPLKLVADQFTNKRINIGGFSNVMVGSQPPPFFNLTAYIETITVIPEPHTLKTCVIGIVQICAMNLIRRARRTRNVPSSTSMPSLPRFPQDSPDRLNWSQRRPCF